MNGTQQTEPFNGYKDEFFGLTITPRKSLTWNVNYYLGQEHPNTTYFLNGGALANAPLFQGVPFEPIANPPHGKLHIFDTYVNWQASPRLTLAGEADYELQRLFHTPRLRIPTGALYMQNINSPQSCPWPDVLNTCLIGEACLLTSTRL